MSIYLHSSGLSYALCVCAGVHEHVSRSLHVHITAAERHCCRQRKRIPYQAIKDDSQSVFFRALD